MIQNDNKYKLNHMKMHIIIMIDSIPSINASFKNNSIEFIIFNGEM